MKYQHRLELACITRGLHRRRDFCKNALLLSCSLAGISDAIFATVPQRSLVTGFLPSKNGFHFDNQWNQIPLFTIRTKFGNITIGNAVFGMCGGMVFAARDFFENQYNLPSDTASLTSASDPLFPYM